MNDLPDEEKKQFEEHMSRRKMLQSLGKFSLIAAMALTGPPILFQGCKSDKSTNVVGPDSDPAPDGSSPSQAIPITLGSTADATIRSSDNKVVYFKFTASQYYDVALVTITAVNFVGGTIGLCTILNSSLEEVSTHDFDGTDDFGFSAETGTWYIKFEATQGGGIVSFSFTEGSPDSWSDYNDWNNYSDAWSNYSDAWSNYSDSWNNYSDSWSNYSDSWSNYSDYGAWGNWIQSW